MNEAIGMALEPARPGRLVRALAPIFEGIRVTQEHIVEYGEHWRERSLTALAEPTQPRIVVLGDSLSQGIGASSTELTWPHRLAIHEAGLRRKPVANIVNLSRSGARIGDVLGVQLSALATIEAAPQLITCTIGSNDLARGATFGKTVAALRSLMVALPANTVLATLPANGSLQAKRLNRIIRDEAADNGLIVADVARQLTTWRGRSAGDRFHPNDLGYEAWYRAFVEALAPSAPTSPNTRSRLSEAPLRR